MVKEISEGVFIVDNKLAVINQVKDWRPFGEYLISEKGVQYRAWDPTRSKLGAAIMKGIPCPIKRDSTVLYLGIAHGFTCSFVSSIASDGLIYGVEFSDRCFKELLPITEKLSNIVPIMADARFPERYADIVSEKVDVVFVDIADRFATEAAIANCRKFLKPSGHLMLSIKTQSIDVTASAKETVKKEIEKLSQAGFEILDWKMLEPFEDCHGFVLAKM